MSFRACFAFMVVLYMAVLLVQVEVSSANNATEASTNKSATPAPEKPEASNATNGTEAPIKTTEAPKASTKAPVTEAPHHHTTPSSGVEGMFSILPFATYALWLVLVAVM